MTALTIIGAIAWTALIFGMGFVLGLKRGAKIVSAIEAERDELKRKISGVV